MNGETFNVDPDFSVIFGCRSSLSLVGLTTAVVGYWLMERKWDNEGTGALEKPDQRVENEAGNGIYIHMYDPNRVVAQGFHPSGERDLVRVRTDDSEDKRYHPGQAASNSTEPIQSLEAAKYYSSPDILYAKLAHALPVPRTMLVGFGLWSLSFFLDPSLGGFRFYANFWNSCCFIFSGLLGAILGFPMRTATLERDAEQKKKAMAAFVACSVLLWIVAIVDPEVDGPWYFNVFGVLFILLSYPAFMASRKMGYTWFTEGKPRSTASITIQNMGPLLLIFGVFLLWVGTNAIYMVDLNQSYIPFWTTAVRGWVVFIAGMFLIVPAHMALDRAFDQGSQPVVPGFRDTYVYKMDGTTFAALARENITRFDLAWMARLLETPLLGSIGWILMGLCSFMPFGIMDPTIQKFFTMFLCFAVPPVQFVLLTPAFWRSDRADFLKWMRVYCALMVALVVAIGHSSGIAFLFSFIGMGLIYGGKRKDFHDERKRGNLWLTESPPSANPSPQVYGLGQPLHVLGWILFCTAMSVPM